MATDEYDPIVLMGAGDEVHEVDLRTEFGEDWAEMADEHVTEIMFDGANAPDRNCLLCIAGKRCGAWKYYGVDDPFSLGES